MIIENLLYLLNCLIFLSGTIFFSYYSLNDFGNKTIIELNCGDMFYLIFIGLINSIICLLTIKNLKLIGFLTTSILLVSKMFDNFLFEFTFIKSPLF